MKIYLNPRTLVDFMTSDNISKIEEDIMVQKLSEIRGSFLMDFGFEGKFELQMKTNTEVNVAVKGKLHGGRTSWRIRAADARTAAALKRQPKWLDRFLR